MKKEALNQMMMGFSMSIVSIIVTLLAQLFPEFFMKYIVFVLFIGALGLFNFLLPAKIGFISKLNNQIKKETENKQKTLALKLSKKFGSNLLAFIPGAEQAVTNILLMFIQNPAVVLPVIMPIGGFFIMIFNSIMDEISKII